LELTLFSKNVILKDFKIRHDLNEGLEIVNRQEDNNENYITLTGSKAQINTYLQDKPVLSDRLRTLNNVPKFRIINTRKERIQ